jgi:hypothetical protein
MIGIVLFFNLQCALIFLATPALFTSSFELAGVSGEMMVRGMGILFLMWNIPYIFAISNPRKRIVSLIESVLMQLAGLVGETFLVLSLPVGHEALRSTGMRFILFDGGGLILLLLALWLVRELPSQPEIAGQTTVGNR